MDATIDLDTLALFVRVAQHRSFTRAAREMGVPTSTVSRAVARLEDQMRTRLVQRTTRRLALTAEGAALFEGADAPLRTLAALTSAVVDTRGTPRGTLRVTAPTDLGPGFAADIVGAFVARHPAVNVEVTITNRTVDLVAEGFDAALRAGALPDSTLVAVKLGETPFRLFAAPSYLALRGTPREPAELAEHDGAMYRGSRGILKWKLRGPAGAIEAKPNPRVIGDDFGFLAGAVREGAGVGLLPELLGQPEVVAGRLVPLLPAYLAEGGGLHLVYPTARHVPAKVTAFRDFVMDRFRSWPGLLLR